jgi:hypothetical protein
MAEVKFSEFPLATGANLSLITVVGLDELAANARFPGTDLKGDKGDQGDPGPTGAQGIQGIQGNKGLTGDTGAQGDQGIQGAQGIQGNIGPTGDTGSQGTQGIQGIQGIQGDAGTGYNLIGDASVAELNGMSSGDFSANDAYFMLDSGTVDPSGAVQSTTVVTGDLVVWSASVYFVNYGPQSGTKGDTGDTGDTGATGDQGIQGIQGIEGAQGVKGDTGDQGIQGIQGATGNTGPQGVQGDQGDAATIIVASTTTLAPNTSATVSNSGTTSAAEFDFGIPQGVAGTTGTAGADGKTYYNGTSLPSPAAYADGDLFMVIP